MTGGEHRHPDPRAWEGWDTPAGVPATALLQLLAADAAARAAEMLAGKATGTHDPVIDAVRLLATTAGAPHVASTARRIGIPEEEVRRLLLAYRHGGTGGVAATLAPTPCGAEEMVAGVDEVRRRRAMVLGELDVEPGAITDAGAGVRLRRGPDGRWYPFSLARGQWWPAAGANTSAGAAYQAGARARSQRRANG